MIPANFEKIEDIKALFPNDFPVVGVGVTAFPRTGLSYILPNYKILSLLETSDLEAIRKACPVVSVEGDLKDEMPEKFNTSGIIEGEKASKWLKENAKGLFVYKASTVTDRIVKEGGFRLLSAPGYIRKVFENKKEFRVEAQKAGLKVPRGETVLVDDLTEIKFEKFQKELSERLVFQLTDYTIGGGLGTFFIDNKQDLREFREFVKRRRVIRAEEGRVIEWVNVTERIEGRAGSIAGCATYYGTVSNVLQNQIMDQPELVALKGRSGVWLGQDWHVHFSEKAQACAQEQIRKWGEYIYKKGYKGIFGLDVMVTKEDEVVVIECNSRYTGAFPVLTMAQLENHEMPMDVWHLLEWLGIEYEMDLEKVQEVYRQPKKASFVILHNLEGKFVTPTRSVRAGVYKFVLPAQIKFIRPGFSLLDIKSDDEFVLCDRVPSQEMVIKPAERLGRLVFKRRIVTDKGELLDWTREVVKAVYDQFELSMVEKPEEKL